MEILTEFDGLQEALKKVKMDENVLPYANGRLCDDKAWNKTQKILNCPEMISAHKFLYNLDMDQLTEDEVDKINQLYTLGCDRGFIVDDLTDWNADEAPEQAEAKPEEKPAEEPVAKPVGGTLFKAKVPCWTVIYSATSKDGDIKTGEAYSNAISAAAAKADVNAKLSRIGYSNIAILAIESTEGCNCSNAGCKEYDEIAVVAEKDDEENADDESSNTDDESSKEDSSSDNSSEDASEEKSTEEETEETSEESSDEGSEEESSEESSEESTEETSDEGSEEESSEESSEEETEEKSDGTEGEEESSDEEESDEEDSDEESDDGEKKEELDANEKAELKDKYRKTFKNTLSKCKFESSFNDLTLEQKVKFFTELSKAWKKNEPNEFMTDKEIEQLNNVVVKPEND